MFALNRSQTNTHGSVTNLREMGPNKYPAANEMPYVSLIWVGCSLKEFLVSPEPSELSAASKTGKD